MALVDRVLAGLKRVVQLDDQVQKLAEAVEALQGDLRDLDRRLIRVETALELASEGRLRPRLGRGEEPRNG